MRAQTALRSARLAGVVYLAIICLGLFGEVIARGSIVVSGDAGATASRLAASPTLWRVGIATDLLMHVLDVPLIVFFYLWLKPFSQSLALLATVLNVVQTCVLAANKMSLVAALLLATSSTSTWLSVSGASASEAHALAYFAISLHGYGFGVGLIFFGFACVVRGYLIFKSDAIPKVLGVLLGIAGACYLVNSFALLVVPDLASMLFPAILLPALVGELALCLWLIFKGHDAVR